MSDKDLESVQAARDLVEAAHRAQAVVASFTQEKIDSICEAMAHAAQRESLRLATLAHEETGYGNSADKNIKNLFSAVDVHNYFKRLRTVGVVRETENIIEIAAPRGVVAAIIPSTNPTSTAIFKILIAIKSRNALVLSPHPSATKCVVETARVMREAAVQTGLPGEAIGCIELTTIEGTEALMKHRLTAVILATGGLGLVRAAYSSGKPAFGVGPGNVPAFIERTANVAKAVKDILASKCFDYGTICASEQAVVADSAIDAEVRAQFASQGAHFLNAGERELLAKLVVTPQRGLNPKIVGKPAKAIAEWAGISIPPGTRCLVAEVSGVGRDFPLSLEKLSPILAYYTASGLEEGARLCDAILHYGGMGHTAAVHSQDRNAILKYGMLMPAARVVVNTPSTHGAIGFSTALAPSMTLGCGSWGGNVTSDNISPLHLMDIKRIAFETRPVTSDETVPSAIGSSSPVAATPGPTTSTTAPQLPIDRAAIASLVDKFLRGRAPAPVSGDASAATAPAPENVSRQAAEFVCEEDVRQAIRNGAKIHINAKTIVTPAARELGDTRDVFAKA